MLTTKIVRFSMLKTKWFRLMAYVVVGLMVATVIAPKVVVGETEQQLPPKFIVGDVAQSILDVKTKGDHIGDTTKTVAPNISGMTMSCCMNIWISPISPAGTAGCGKST